jgi:hypothetical protein
MADLREYARTAAARNGIDPGYFERQIDQESGFNPRAYNAGSGASGIAQIIERWHPGVDVWNPEASLDYAAGLVAGYLKQTGSYPKALAAYNWGIGNVLGYTHNGVTVPPWDGRRETLPAETRHYLDVILGPSWDQTGDRVVTYNASEPAIPQNDDWSCAPTSTRWALKAVGRNPSEQWIESTMIAEGVVSTSQGLLDASGAGLADFLRRQYGEFGYGAKNEPITTFDALAAEAGRYPLLIGGRRWGSGGHWSGVRGYDAANGVLLLANPADGWGGIHQTMSRDQMAGIGPFSMVRLTHPDLMTINEPGPTDPSGPPGEPAPPGQPDAQEAARLRTVLGYVSHDVAAAIDKEIATVEAALGALKAAVQTLRRQE